MIDIFTQERRIDNNVYYKRIMRLVQNTYYPHGYSDGCHNLFEAFNHYIKLWEYNKGACYCDEYLSDLEIYNPPNTEDIIQQLKVIQFILNIIKYIPDISNFDSDDRRHKPYIELQRLIDFYLEKVNYKTYLEGDMIKISKRDADVDSVLRSISCDEELAISLLSYYDIDIENNIEAKKEILLKIAGWMEPKRVFYDSIDKELSRDVFKLFNNAKIRHTNDKQYVLTDQETIDIYDKTFKLVLHLIRTEDIKAIHKEIADLEEKN